MKVSRAIGTNSRIASEFLYACPGFGVICFKKDILNQVYLAEIMNNMKKQTFLKGSQ